uniref:G-protein coupled receptors family 1 profile domain-containing protein n=1 Tax=Cavia porcellus TaxID=10141 RepID=A0A286XKP9_CAVPO
MLIPNNSEIKFLLLIRIPGLDYAHMWISIPICLMYLVAITGNCIIIFIIRTEPSLHEPMCYSLPCWLSLIWNFLSHSYCLQDIMKLACSDNKTNFMYGFFVALCTMLGLAFIFVSYVPILKTVLSTASLMERLKALNTCVSHICAVLIFYVAIITLGAIHCFAKHKNPLVTVLIADMFLLVPPLMNSIVYCVKTRQIHEKVLRKFLNICER